MKTAIHILVGIMVISAFAQCANSKKLISRQPDGLELGEVVSEPWKTENGPESGINLFIPVISGHEITLDSAYYRGKAVQLEKVQRDSHLVYIGKFKDAVKPDIIMHADPRKEAGNRPPEIIPPIPFELGEDEAVVSYRLGEDTKYFRISGVKEMKPVTENPG